MYVGHLAVAIASTRVTARVPLVLLLLVSQLPDWVELAIARRGAIDDAVTYSHSLPAVAAGMVVCALLYGAATRDIRGAALLAAVCATHPILDLVTGAKAWWPGGPLLGINLYDRPLLDWSLEAALAVAGWWIYTTGEPRLRWHRNRWLILGTLLFCQGTLDLAQAVRILRRSGAGAAWMFSADAHLLVPILTVNALPVRVARGGTGN